MFLFMRHSTGFFHVGSSLAKLRTDSEPMGAWRPVFVRIVSIALAAVSLALLVFVIQTTSLDMSGGWGIALLLVFGFLAAVVFAALVGEL